MIDIHVHHSPDIDNKLDRILSRLEILIREQRRLMATQEELLQELVEINATTDELASDVDTLIAKADNPAEKEAVKAQLVTLKDKLKSIASKYTPDVVDPADPNVTGRRR